MKHRPVRTLSLTLTLLSLAMIGGAPRSFACTGANAGRPQQQGSSGTPQQSDPNQVPPSQSGQSSATPSEATEPDNGSKSDKNGEKNSDKSGDKNQAPLDATMARLKITVASAESNKPIGNASVYVRYPEGYTRLTHKEKLAEMNFKTNLDGSLKVPSVPRGKVLIQVVAPGWHTFGQWYDVEKDEMQIEIKLDKPPHWY